MSFKKFLKKAVKVVLPGAWEAGEGLVNAGEKAWSHISGERGAEKQNQANMKAWEMQNEYNTPANQMQRLLDAGLNPNLAYSNVDTGNAKSAPDIGNVGDPVGAISGMLGHAFNAVGLLNSIQARKEQNDARLFQEQHQRDVLDFQKHQAAVSEAFRTKELAMRQSHNEREYNRWMRDYDFRVYDADRRFNEMERHNRALENRGSIGSHTYHLFDSAIRGLSGGQHTDDSLTGTTHMMRRYAIKQLENYLDPRKNPFQKAFDMFTGHGL